MYMCISIYTYTSIWQQTVHVCICVCIEHGKRFKIYVEEQVTKNSQDNFEKDIW